MVEISKSFVELFERQEDPSVSGNFGLTEAAGWQAKTMFTWPRKLRELGI